MTETTLKKISFVDNELLKEIVKRIVNSVHPERIVLFGSYAYGIPTEDSDLDLLVIVKSSKKPRYQRAREIRKHLWGIADIPKDILVYTQGEIDEWKEVKEAFITSIVGQGRILYENKEGVAKELD